MSDLKTSKLALAGISIALIILCLYGGSIIKNNKIFFLAFAVIMGSIPYMYGGIKYGMTAYLASVFLALALVPNKIYVLVYVIFGVYPLVKLLSQRNNIVVQYIIKYIWFNASVILSFIIFKSIIYVDKFFLTIIGITIIIIVAQILFFIFDYFFNICTNYIYKILKGVRKNGY